MKNKATRLMAILLSATMLFSLAACGKSDDNKEQSSSAVSSSATDSSSVEASSSEEKEIEREPITITWGVNSAYLTGGEGVLTDKYPVLQVIKDKFNIEIEWVGMDADKTTLWATTGSLPDINNLVGGVDFKALLDSNQLMELTDLLDEYGQDIKTRMGTPSINHLTETYGGLYVLPIGYVNTVGVPATNAYANGFCIRMDLYFELGSPQMTNEDELLQVLKDMQDMQREATGEDDIYGYSAYSAPASSWFAYNYGTDISPNCHTFRANTGELTCHYCDADSVGWKVLEFMNKAWKMGILDPETFTQDASALKAKVQAGKALSNNKTTQPDPDVCGENAIMAVPIGAFEYIGNVYGNMNPFGSGISTESRFISSSCEYPERIIEMLNWLDTADGARTWMNGVQGVDWDYDENGTPVMIGDMLEAYESGNGNAYKDTRIVPYAQNFLTSYADVFEDGYAVKIYESEEYRASTSTTAYVNFSQRYGDFYYPGQVYDDLVKKGVVKTSTNNVARSINGLLGARSDEANRISSDAGGVVNARYAELVMAEDFEAVKADVIEQMNKLGLQDLHAEMEVLYEEAREKYIELFGEIE